jgi:hypothetical protein
MLVLDVKLCLPRVLEMSLEWAPAVLIILLLHLLACLESPLRYTNHKRTIQQSVTVT